MSDEPEVAPEPTLDLGLRHDGKPRKRRKLAPEERKPQVRTIAERRAAALKRAAAVKAERNARIPLRLGVGLEMFEGLVTISEKTGATVPNVALRAMAMGMEQWARQLRVKLEEFEAEPLSVFETVPVVARAHRDYGTDEIAAREEIRTRAQQAEAERDGMATQLHIPGRRRATG